jgi:membrane-bound serine protease (ClpP class)
VLAALFLFDDAEGVSVDPAAAIPLAVMMFVLVVLAGRVAFRTRHAPSTSTGPEHLVGRVVPVREASGTTGRTFTEGSWWSLRSAGPPLEAGTSVRVLALEGLKLVVEPEEIVGQEPEKTWTEGPGRETA